MDSDNIVVGIGYNGMPINCSDIDFPWEKSRDLPLKDTKHAYVVHAELNAILNSTKVHLDGCTLYVTHFPCHECTKAIVQRRISRIVFYNYEKYSEESGEISRRMLDANRIDYQKYQDTLQIDINASGKEIAN